MQRDCPRCSPAGMDSLTALAMVRKFGCRVTFGEEVTVERVAVDGPLWEIVARGPSFVEAMAKARDACGWSL